MINDNSALQKTINETDADMTTMEGRIEWFCAHFDVQPPMLEYDADEPEALLLTDGLFQWIQREGANLDWLFCGSVTGALTTYREKHKRTDEEHEFITLLGKLDGFELELFAAGVETISQDETDATEVMQGVSAKIREYRAKKALNCALSE